MPATLVNVVPLTDRSIRALKPSEGGRRDYMFPDSRVRGFGLRVFPSGVKQFFVRYKKAGKLRRYSIGKYPMVGLAEARERAERMVGRLADGKDPQEERMDKRAVTRFGELANDYLSTYAKPRMKPRSFSEEKRVIDHDLLPTWRSTPITGIRRRDVASLLDGIIARGAAVQANRTRSVILRIFTFAVERELVEYNPVIGLRKPTEERSRDRVLAADEIRDLWLLWEKEDSTTSALFQFLLLTGQRIGATSRLRWVDIKDSWMTMPTKGRPRNGRLHRVYLGDAAQHVLARLWGPSQEKAERQKRAVSEWVFASPRTEGHIVSVSTAKKRYKDKAGVRKWTPHDLRRTAATIMGDLEVPDGVIGLVLGHVPTGVIARYSRSRREHEVQRALQLWAGRLGDILAAQSQGI